MSASSSKLSHSAARFEELKASVSDCDYELIDIVLLFCTLAESWMKAVQLRGVLLAAIILPFLDVPLCTVGQFLFVCPAWYCSNETCTKIEHCDGIVKLNGSTCGCCPLCVRQLGRGESCFLDILGGGGAKGVECASGLFCDPRTVTCEETPRWLPN
ncbi:hypothetical protein HPB47_003214 [Ixodes persulcatus]|uniref:Uncharacterized protein n=1 Tax=Ixodes persulcatus TaxID=34615 RepID=A0AC60PJ27_IXOPE|nr:hypothetical protein HPB47_003214 [Ixodes persulcatus]